MVKYGKKFRKIQLPEWKGKYFDYKKFKQFIKKIIQKICLRFKKMKKIIMF